MSLFVNATHLHNQYLDCNATNVSETIEYDCLSVLHKLHDQVNGPQLVQVVVQPLARLFNPNAINNISTGGPNQSSVAPNGISTNFQQNAFISGQVGPNPSSLSLSTSTSTYMMSPDTAQALIARLDTDRDVNWLMEIVGYGLSMPFSITSEQDSVKDCCTIYLEWLSAALLPFINENNEDNRSLQLTKLVPVPIRNDPNRYARKMLSHLYNVFLPRQTSNNIGTINSSNSTQREQTDREMAALSRQAVLCHRVLRTLENIAQNPMNLMDKETWDHLLALLLTVNNKLLAQPTQPDIGTQLQERILGVLFDLVLLASCKSIHMTSIWRTFHSMCLSWRHRPALIDHWRRVTLLLTKKIIRLPHIQNSPGKCSVANRSSIMSFDNFSHLVGLETAIATMTQETLSQTWYRFLNLIGNPVDLTDPRIISKTNEFYDYACASQNVMDPSQHPCLNVLPNMFTNSMLALRDIVDTFLTTCDILEEDGGTLDATSMERLQISRKSVTSISSSITAISSTTNIPINSSSNQSNQQQQSQLSATPSAIQQAVTPTQTRRVTKSITMKGNKMMPFKSPSMSSQNQAQLTDLHNQQHKDDQSASTTSRQNQANESRASLTTTVTGSLKSDLTMKLSSDRPKINSILHLFGDWLFSAALIGSELKQELYDSDKGKISPNHGQHPTDDMISVDSSIITESCGPSSQGRRFSQSKASFSLTPSGIDINKQSNQEGLKSHDINQSNSDKNDSNFDNFEVGQAEAMTILCRIFCSKSSSEDISPNYLSRFYLCLQHCLTSRNDNDKNTNNHSNGTSDIKRNILASVLMYSTNLFQKDLDGINLLIPSFISAIEYLFECSERDIPIQPPPRSHGRSGSMKGTNTTTTNMASNELRKACIQTLLNLLAYPYHFQNLAIRNCLNENSPTTTFGSLRPRLVKLLFIALQTETDATNMQILFGGLSLAIYDLASNATKLSLNNRAENEQTLGLNQKGSKSNSTTNNKTDNSEYQHHSYDSNKISYHDRDDPTRQSSFIGSSRSAFLIKSLHVTCHLLISTWKHDTQVSLAALDLLTMIARVTALPELGDFKGMNIDAKLSSQSFPTRSIQQNNKTNVDHSIIMKNEYNQATKWICDYICNQCSRPPPAHSRDMHSTIVAAYQCLSIWVSNHPYLLQDLNCVNTFMEVIELGVSGQKSKSTNFDSTGRETSYVINKDVKILKPSSMRVREAAEFLLNICMLRPPLFESNIPIDLTYDGVLDEFDLVELFGDPKLKNDSSRYPIDQDFRRLESHKQFKYFSDENAILYGFMENMNAGDPNLKDSIICLLRTPFGRYSCRFKFNCYPDQSRDMIMSNRTMGLIKRPFVSTPNSEQRLFQFPEGQNKSLYFNKSAKFFPDTIQSIVTSELDLLVDTLDDYYTITDKHNSSSFIKNSNLRQDLDKMSKIFHHQVLAEQNVMNDTMVDHRLKSFDCEEPQPTSEFSPTRMLVTQLGLKNYLGGSERISMNLIDDLKSIDDQPIKICDVASIFYIRKGRTSAREILESVKERRNISLDFYEWLLELAQPVLIKNHPRWTGKLSSSWKGRPYLTNNNNKHHNETYMKSSSMKGDLDNQSLLNNLLTSDNGGSLFDGEKLSLYWSDMCQELAFLVPHKIEVKFTTLNDGSDMSSNNSGSSPGTTNYVNSDGSSAINVNDLDSQSSFRHRDSQNSDRQSFSSATSDASNQSIRTLSHNHSPSKASTHNLPTNTNNPVILGNTLSSGSTNTATNNESHETRETISVSRQSISTNVNITKHSIKSTHPLATIGCDTNIIICWLESPDDYNELPSETLLEISQNNCLYEHIDEQQKHQSQSQKSIGDLSSSYSPPTKSSPRHDEQQHHSNYNLTNNNHAKNNNHQMITQRLRSREYAKYFISPMKNGLYRINLQISIGRQNLALPLVDGMTVSQGTLSSLIRESILNFCRRRRLDAESYQPPHVKRRQKIQKICTNNKISSRFHPMQYYDGLFKTTKS